MNRKLLIILLDDEFGINYEAYVLLKLCYYDQADMKEVFDNVHANDGRYYLPEGHGLE